MEQHSARVSAQSEQQAVPAARRPARPSRTARAPGAGGGPTAGGAAVRGTPGARAGGAAGWTARLPRPRLTGLGAGVLSVLAMVVVGTLDALLLNSHAATYGVLFLLVSAASAAWVRPADLMAPPVAAPLAFTAGLFCILRGAEGFGGTVMGMFTGLSLLAGWVYGGTLLAAVIVVVRRVLYVARRRAGRTARTARDGRTVPAPQPAAGTAGVPVVAPVAEPPGHPG